ncbi:MAG: TRAP transporter substrate-binding protein [Thermincola sp.]|jgi:TRAP-type C4-dicarboxylate transport system substrate-binding protein|nr:TRAP transporter substrate-binding protein [Thermincola sp.]MDT3701824.1 TRAP transporter substrate-binding protein [Thermincola sp.]
MLKVFKAKGYYLLGIVLVLTILTLAGCGGSADQNTTDKGGAAGGDAKPVSLTLAHFWPATHEMETKIVAGYIAEIDKATGGKVKITSYPAGTLTPSNETYDGVTKGVADIGISAYSYNRGRFPVVESFLLPGLEYNNSSAASAALVEGIAQLNPQELQDTHHMFSFAAGPGDLYTKKPVRSLEDLKGMQVGATAGLRADAVGLLGATPVVQPMPEWYESLSKGVMDGGVSPVEVLQGFRLGEVSADYITLTPFLYNQAFFVVMNNDKWNSLPADLQQAITDVNKKYFTEVIAPWFDSIDEKGMKWVKEKKKVEVITLSDAEKAKWMEKLQPLEATYIKTLNEKGLPGEDIMKTVRELTDKANAEFPEKAPYTK